MTRTQTSICIIALMLAMTCAQAYMASHGDWLSESTSKLSYFTLSLLIALLIERDRMVRGRTAPFEFAAFVFFAWPLIAPYYFFSVMRWRGLAIGLGLVLLAMLPDIALILFYQ